MTKERAALKLIREIANELDKNPSAVPQWVADEVRRILRRASTKGNKR